MTRILTTVLFATATFLVGNTATAQSRGGYTYDYAYDHSYDIPTGSTYTTYRTGSSTTVYGANTRTGSTWSGTYNQNGSSWGIDSSGNVWTYDARSSVYTNSSGRVCVGTGQYRTCN